MEEESQQSFKPWLLASSCENRSSLVKLGVSSTVLLGKHGESMVCSNNTLSIHVTSDILQREEPFSYDPTGEN